MAKAVQKKNKEHSAWQRENFKALALGTMLFARCVAFFIWAFLFKLSTPYIF